MVIVEFADSFVNGASGSERGFVGLHLLMKDVVYMVVHKIFDGVGAVTGTSS